MPRKRRQQWDPISRVHVNIHVYIHRLTRFCQLTDSVYRVNSCDQTPNNIVLLRILPHICYTV